MPFCDTDPQVDDGALTSLASIRVENLGLFANDLGDSGARELAAASQKVRGAIVPWPHTRCLPIRSGSGPEIMLP